MFARLNGIDIMVSEMLPPSITWISLPRYSKNRSRRIWKKILKRVRQTSSPGWNQAYMIGGKMIVHPTTYEQLRKEHAEKKIDTGDAYKALQR